MSDNDGIRVVMEVVLLSLILITIHGAEWPYVLALKEQSK